MTVIIKPFLILIALGWTSLALMALAPYGSGPLRDRDPNVLDCIHHQAIQEAERLALEAQSSLSAGRIEDYADEIHQAGNLIDLSLACSPLEGNYWLSHAFLKMKAAGIGPEIEQAILNSAYVSPREPWVARRRVALILLSFTKPGPVLDDIVRQDLRLIFKNKRQWQNSEFGKQLPFERISPYLEPK